MQRKVSSAFNKVKALSFLWAGNEGFPTSAEQPQTTESVSHRVATSAPGS
jgi:hypothetical protein